MSVKISSLNTASTISSGDDINIAGNNPLTFSDWGGGWYMTDSAWIRSYNSKSLWIGAGVIGGDGGLTIGYGGTSYGTNNAIIAGNVGIGTASPIAKLTVNELPVAELGSTSYGSAVIHGTNYNLSNTQRGIVDINYIDVAAQDNGSTLTFTNNAGMFGYGYSYVGVGLKAGKENSTNQNKATYFAISTNNNSALTEQFRITSAGLVGIGTSSPSEKLHVAGVGRFDNVIQSFGNWSTSYPILQLLDTKSGGKIWNIENGRNSNNLEFHASDVGTVFSIQQSSGNVGIGTTSPGYKLDVVGEARFGSNYKAIIGNDGTYGAYSTIGFGGTSNGYNRVFGQDGTADGLYLASATGRGIAFRVNGGTTDNMLINSNGNVLIGTTTDAGYKLNVNGDIRTSQGLYGAGLLEFTGGWSASPYNSSSWIRAASGTGLFLVNNGITKWAGFKPNDDFVVNNADLYISASSGNVLIGTTTDSGYKFYVNGTGRFSNDLIGVNGISDSLYSRITSPGGGASLNNAPITAAIKIALPADGSFLNTMISFTIHIYTYSTGKSRTIKVGGYSYYDTSWYNVFTYQSGGSQIDDINIRFGTEGGCACVWVGETTSYWDYPNIFITDVQVGHSQSPNLTKGWNVSLVSSFGTVQSTYVAYKNITTYNIGSQSVSYATTAGALTSMLISQFTNDSGYVTSGALAAYLPLAGGTLTGNLIGTSARFISNGNALILSRATGSLGGLIAFTDQFNSINARIGIEDNNNDFIIEDGANNRRLIISNTTGAATFSSSVTASSLIKSGGTSTQYLMADGSVSTLTNPVTGTGTTNYLPKFTGASALGNSNLVSDASGNLGLGVTPSTWTAGGQNIEFGSAGNIIQGQASQIAVIQNATFNVGWKYSANGFASFALQTSGQHQWFNAPSGTTGNAITFTQAMTLDASGQLGIGTTTPAVKLQVDNNSHNYFLLNSTVANFQTAISAQNTSSNKRISLSWEDGTRGDYGELYSSTYLAITTSSSEKIRITTGGNVLIGTTTDAGYKLDVNGSIKSQGILFEKSPYETRSIGLDTYGWYFYNNTDSRYDMLIDASGNVGIGTTSPGAKLEVNGNIKLSGAAGATSTPSYIWLGNDYSNGVTRDKLKIYLYNSGVEQYGFTVGSIGDVQYHSNAFHDFYTNNSLSLRINSSGNVGIGTTIPNGKLNVVDTLNNGTYGAVNITNNVANVSYGHGLIVNVPNFAVGWGGNTNYSLAKFMDAGGDAAWIGGAQSYFRGNVGIGTTTPGYKLDVNGTTRLNSNVTIGNGTTTTSKLTILATTGVAAPGSPTLGIYDEASPSFGFDFDLEGVVTGDLYLSRLVAGTRTSVLQIARATGAATFSNRIDATGATFTEAGSSILIVRSTSNSGYATTDYYNSSNSQVASFGYGNASVPASAVQNAAYIYTAAGVDFVGYMGGAERFRIASTGAATFNDSVTLSSTASSFIVLNNTTPTTGKGWRTSSAGNGNFYITQVGVVDAITLSPTTGAATFSSSVTAGSFIKSGGTSAQFLKADGSIDSNTYATTSALAAYLPLSGGTITGDLTVNNKVYVGTHGCYFEEVLIGSTYELRVVDSAGNMTVLS